MQSYTVRFHVDAPPRKVWQVLHPPAPPDAPRPRVLTWPGGSMEILNEGNEAGEGLVRTCVYQVPRYLLTRGKARSWETVTEAKLNKLSRYVAVGAPLWSRAEGYHELEEQPDGTTVLTFLAVFLIQNSQNRDGAAIQAKLDEILRALENAREDFVGIEHLTDSQICAIRDALEKDIKNASGKGKTTRPSVERLLERVRDDLLDVSVVENMPKLEGRQMIMVLAPKKKK